MKPLPYKFQCQNLDKIAVQIDYKILHHFKVLTHGTLHSSKCLPVGIASCQAKVWNTEVNCWFKQHAMSYFSKSNYR